MRKGHKLLIKYNNCRKTIILLKIFYKTLLLKIFTYFTILISLIISFSSALCFLEDELLLITTVVHSEASGESLDGKKAIANVILNRVNHEDFPNNIHDVVFMKNAFAKPSKCTCDNKECYEATKLIFIEEEFIFEDNIISFQKAKDSNWYGLEPITKIENHWFYG